MRPNPSLFSSIQTLTLTLAIIGLALLFGPCDRAVAGPEINCTANISLTMSVCGGPGGPPVVDTFDLLALLESWGQSGVAAELAEPFDTTDTFDLLTMLEQWGACPGTPCPLMNGCLVHEGWIGQDDCQSNCECVDGALVNCEGPPVCNVPCFVNGKPIPSGTPDVLIDDCNTCTCLHGELVDCTDLTCFAPCFFMGKPVPHGGMITGECEVCTCAHGVLECDLSGCD